MRFLRNLLDRALDRAGEFIADIAQPVGALVENAVHMGLNAVAPGFGTAARALSERIFDGGIDGAVSRALGNLGQRGADAIRRGAEDIARRGLDTVNEGINRLFSGDVNALNVCVNDLVPGGGSSLNRCIDNFITEGAGALNRCFDNLVAGGAESIHRCIDNLNQQGVNILPEVPPYVEPEVGGIISAIDSLIPGGIPNIFNLGLGIGAILALGTMLYAGILYSISGDNASQQKEAKAWMWAAAKGLALLAFGVVLINIINPGMREIEEVETNEAPFVEVNDQFNTSPPRDEAREEPWEETGEETVVVDGVVLEGVARRQVPLLKQGQEPWGSMPYGNCKKEDSSGLTTFAEAGCGPAALAMVVRYFTGNDNITPLSIGQLAVNNSFRKCRRGTDPDAMTAIPRHLGLTSTVIRGDWREQMICLRRGGLIIAQMRAVTSKERTALKTANRIEQPIFTTSGHFLVVTGLGRSSLIFINDPGPRNVQTSDIFHYMDFKRKSWCIEK